MKSLIVVLISGGAEWMPVDLTPILQTGATGAFLVWLMYQVLPRLDRIERALDFLSRVQLLDIVSRDGVPDVNKRQAESMLRQTETKYPQAGGGP